MGMQVNQLKPRDKVVARRQLNPVMAKHWTYASINASIGGGIMQGAVLEVVEVSQSPNRAKLAIPGRTPPAFLTFSGQEMVGLFDMVAGTPTPSPPPSQNLALIFQRMSQRQMAVSSGLAALRDARNALKSDIQSARFWGNIAVFANAAMLPLNVMINAFEAKAAVTVYQTAVKELYGQLGKSGTRMESGAIKTSLSIIKKATVEALKSKGLTNYVPGVNILVGFAEDSVALFQTASMVSDGSNEMRQIMRTMEAKIAEAEQTFIKIGIEMDRLLTEMQRRARTA